MIRHNKTGGPRSHFGMLCVYTLTAETEVVEGTLIPYLFEKHLKS